MLYENSPDNSNGDKNEGRNKGTTVVHGMGHNVWTETGQNPKSEVGNGVGTGVGHSSAHDVTAKSKQEVHMKQINKGKETENVDLVCLLLRAMEDNLIGLKDDIDFTFPWQTVKHKNNEFVDTKHFIDLLKKEYGSTCTFYMCTSYCVEVTETQTGNKHNVTLKVGQNELTGNINSAIIVSIKCDKKKDVKKKRRQVRRTFHGLECCQNRKR